LAEAELRRAIDLDPGNSDAYRRLGFVFQRNRQLDEALAAYQKAVQVGPAYAKNFEYLGFFQYQQANYEEAARQYRKALELAPDESQRYFELGNALINLGEFGEAESRFREALRLSEGAETLESLGVALMYQKRYAEALPSLTRSASLAPEDHQVWMNLAICYHLLGRATESEQANRRGRDLADGEVARNPRDGRIRANLAFLSARLGDRRRAISEAAQALRFSGDNADTRFMTAYAYEVLGQRADALSVLSASPRQVIADVSRWPDMAALQADPQFSQLLVSQHPK